MISNNRVKPISCIPNTSDAFRSVTSLVNETELGKKNAKSSNKEVNDLDSLSTVGLEESSYLKLRPFTRLDPTLARLLNFLNCFGLTVNFVKSRSTGTRRKRWTGSGRDYSKYMKIVLMIFIGIITGEVVYDVNLRQSKLLAEQKRSTPLLTFVIVAYSWLTLVIPILCDISLVFLGSNLFRFYSRTTATVCNGMFFGKRTSVDSWYYYLLIVLITFLDAAGQVVVLGVWPESIDSYMRMLLVPDRVSSPADSMMHLPPLNENHSTLWFITPTNTTNKNPMDSIETYLPSIKNFEQPTWHGPKVRADLLDFLLGDNYAHSDLGVSIKILCLMVQLIHSYAFLMIIISLANHYATVINNINDNLDKYEFRRLLKQLIVLRDSSEQISLMISIPFAFVIVLVFMRQIALNGVFIQSTMLPYENWAVSLQSFTCSVSIFMVFIYCDGLQGASKQTHRLKTEQTVINDNKGGNQSIYEFLDYLNRLSKSIRITFFNIIAINKSSLVGLYGHILTLTFVTS